jgi:AhpD family alkylhydroperoxidase
MTHFEFSQNFNGIAEVFIRRPNYYKPLLEFLEQVMVAESNLSKIDREVLATYVSQLNGCHFCVAAHIATLQGLNAEKQLFLH